MASFLLLRARLACLVMLGIGLGIVLWLVHASEPAKQSIEPARVRAWEKIESRLRIADKRSEEGGGRQVQRVKEFFAERRGRARAFADDLLGWNAKWILVKGWFASDGGKGQREHMRESFSRHIFTTQDLKELLESVVIAHLSEMEGEENSLLVEIQADLGEQDLPELRVLLAAGNQEGFKAEYRKMVEHVSPIVGRDFKVAVGREVMVWVGSDIATAVTIRVASAAAVRLGISGGILGTGAASGAATLGIGIVVGFLVDGAVDWTMKQAGYNPAGDIAREVSSALTRMESLIVDGDAEANAAFAKLRHLQASDPFSFVRDECRNSADHIETAGVLGLRHELARLQHMRSRLREEALRKLILEGGTP